MPITLVVNLLIRCIGCISYRFNPHWYCMKIWTRCDTLALLLNCIATEEFWGWIFISWIENQISWTFCDCGVSTAGPGFSDSITFDTVIFDTITFDTIKFDTKHFVPPFHFSLVGKHWQFQFGILTLNALTKSNVCLQTIFKGNVILAMVALEKVSHPSITLVSWLSI